MDEQELRALSSDISETSKRTMTIHQGECITQRYRQLHCSLQFTFLEVNLKPCCPVVHACKAQIQRKSSMHEKAGAAKDAVIASAHRLDASALEQGLSVKFTGKYLCRISLLCVEE